MADTSYRMPAPAGGLIDRAHQVTFSFDGQRYQGFAGDTIASALLANGVKLFGRSFKYHRPRGVFSIGSEEPNALVTIEKPSGLSPNSRASTAPIYPGMIAKSQHHIGSLRFDVGRINDYLSTLIPAGFYYKTFMWPDWHLFEPMIRRAAGLGPAPASGNPDQYRRRHCHCDVLVVGAGLAGIMAAHIASQAGADVLMIDEHSAPGGMMRFESKAHYGELQAWCKESLDKLAGGIRFFGSTTAYGYYDHNTIGAMCEHPAGGLSGASDQADWHGQDWGQNGHAAQPGWNLIIHAKSVVLATGAIEQPIVTAGNDLPGVMQASALRGYINGFAARPFSNSVIFANNDDAWKSAFDLLRSGGQIALIVDVREDPDPNLVARAKALGIEVLPGHVISRIRGSKSGVEAVEIACLDGRSFRVCRCDSVAMSGGFAPTVHLFSQSGGTLTFDEQAGIWLGDTAKQPCFLAGMAAGHMGVLSGLKSAIRAGAAAANAAGFAARETIDQKLRARFADFINEPTGVCARRIVPNQSMQGGKAFIDLQNDVTTKDLSLAWQEGYRSGEHLKRYTTLGMGTDQGKTANVAGHAMMAGKRSLPAGKAGLTTFRPPYVPVGVGLLAGGEVGEDFRPLRRTPMDSWHEAHGAEWMDAGLWRRPRYYRSNGNTLFDACKNEVRTTRSALGMADISTLGKITLAGPDTAEFLNRIYANAFAKLPVGKARYGLMLREDGILFDDGTTARLSEDEYYMTTTTANAAHVMEWLDYYLQIVWPDLRVFASSVSEQWAAMSIAGPHARDLLAGLVDIDLAGASFPFMAAASCKLGAIAIRLLRISFSGELAFEIHCPADYGLAAWQMLEAHGQKLGICTYGLEALGTMRIEKGHPAGGELDGTTTLADLGLAKARKKQGDYVGRLLEQRPALQEDTRLQLVGVQALSEHSGTGLRIGAQLAPDGDGSPSHGHVTASAFSPELGKSIGLALLQNGRARIGEQIVMCDPLHGRTQSVEIVPPCFIDREGVRQHA